MLCKYINFVLQAMNNVICLYNSIVCESAIQTWVLKLLVLESWRLKLVLIIKLDRLLIWWIKRRLALA